jgi:hypothetical protein
MSNLTERERKHVFERALDNSGLGAPRASATTDILRNAFQHMRSRLEEVAATPQDIESFARAIEKGIRQAQDLSEDEKAVSICVMHKVLLQVPLTCPDQPLTVNFSHVSFATEAR